VEAPLPGQTPLSGHQGRAVQDSYHRGDATMGRVALPEIRRPRQPIGVLVGGGSDCSKTFVGLEVDGQIVSRACGQQSEVLQPALLATRRHAGRTGRVVIVDQDAGPWGHVLADDVIVPRDLVVARAE
jgi:hypothetical protein